MPPRVRQHLARYGAIVALATGCDRPPPNPYEHAGPFAQLALGGTHTCARKASGDLACWKFGRLAEAPIPSGRFLQVSAGSSHACAVRDDHRVACWGACSTGSCAAPAGSFASVSVDGRSCGLDTTGTVHCWGQRAVNPPGVFRQIDAGPLAVCGVTVDDDVHCWGVLSFTPMSPGVVPHATSLKPPAVVRRNALQVSVGNTHACALLMTGRVVCWGDNHVGQTVVPAGTYRAVVAGRDRSCGLTTRGEVVCWGSPITWMHKTYVPPAGPFVEVDLGDSHACARRSNGAVVCWGVDQQSQVSGERWMLIRN